jgi:hypothetical protein
MKPGIEVVTLTVLKIIDFEGLSSRDIFEPTPHTVRLIVHGSSIPLGGYEVSTWATTEYEVAADNSSRPSIAIHLATFERLPGKFVGSKSTVGSVP